MHSGTAHLTIWQRLRFRAGPPCATGRNSHSLTLTASLLSNFRGGVSVDRAVVCTEERVKIRDTTSNGTPPDRAIDAYVWRNMSAVK